VALLGKALLRAHGEEVPAPAGARWWPIQALGRGRLIDHQGARTISIPILCNDGRKGNLCSAE
jgi:hypothetical protein